MNVELKAIYSMLSGKSLSEKAIETVALNDGVFLLQAGKLQSNFF